MHATVKGRTIGKMFTKWAGGLVAGHRIWCGSGQDVHLNRAGGRTMENGGGADEGLARE